MIWERVYRVLLLAYPSEYRREYGEPMVQLFRDRMRRDGGRFRTPVVWAQIISDLVCSAFREHVEGVEMLAMIATVFGTILEPRRRWGFLGVMLALIGIFWLVFEGTARTANESWGGSSTQVEYGTLENWRNQIDAALAERVSAGEMTPEQARQTREYNERYWLTGIYLYSILYAPNSIQMFAQGMVTMGALFALVLGIISGRAALSSRDTNDASSRRRLALVPYFLAPVFLWTLLTAAVVGMALFLGVMAPSVLTNLKDPYVYNSTRNLAIAVAGVWLAGFAWSAVGVSLAVIIRSARLAVIVGVLILVAEVSIGSFLDIIQTRLPFTVPILLPTHGAIELVSIDAPELYHGLFTPGFGHPLHGPHPVAGLILLVSVGSAAIGLGLRAFRNTRGAQSPTGPALE